AAVAACTWPAGKGSHTGGPGSRVPVALEFWGGPNGEQRQDQVATWNTAHPEAQVTFRAVPAVGQGTRALRTFAAAVAGQTAPHVLDFDRFQVATYVNWQVFRPLDGYLSRDRAELERFLPVALDEAYSFDKRLYGLPSSVDNRLLYWNKAHFAEAGLDPETPPATWEALKAYALQLGRQDRLGFHPEQGQASLHLFAWQNGGGFQAPDGKTATLGLARNTEALQWMADLVDELGGWPALQALRERWTSRPEGQHPFLTGELAMELQLPNWAGDTLGRYGPQTAFGVAAPPVRRAGDPPLTWSGGYSYVMSRETKDGDAAWELVKWLVGEEAYGVAYDGELARARTMGGMYRPGLTGQPALDDKMLARYQTGLPAVDAVADVARRLLPRTRVRERSIAAADLWDGVLRAQGEALSGQSDPQRALESNNALVQRALDQAWVFAPK
ncbi:MAG: extracellular solute-binding protein, partial [Chloroflexota bacterium]|nr:extracellular solute-binding protein [Chloroflexota bacterium]